MKIFKEASDKREDVTLSRVYSIPDDALWRRIELMEE